MPCGRHELLRQTCVLTSRVSLAGCDNIRTLVAKWQDLGRYSNSGRPRDKNCLFHTTKYLPGRSGRGSQDLQYSRSHARPAARVTALSGCPPCHLMVCVRPSLRRDSAIVPVVQRPCLLPFSCQGSDVKSMAVTLSKPRSAGQMMKALQHNTFDSSFYGRDAGDGVSGLGF